MPLTVLGLGLVAVVGLWVYTQRAREEIGATSPAAAPERGAMAPPGPAETLGRSWTLIERWAALNERVSRLHEHLATLDTAAADLTVAEEATWVDLKAAHDAVMRVASTLEKADAGARDGDDARREQHVREARELLVRSEALLRRADERLSSVGY